jgi:ribosomal protein S18 acetylase RimI-like enzyme
MDYNKTAVQELSDITPDEMPILDVTAAGIRQTQSIMWKYMHMNEEERGEAEETMNASIALCRERIGELLTHEKWVKSLERIKVDRRSADSVLKLMNEVVLSAKEPELVVASLKISQAGRLLEESRAFLRNFFEKGMPSDYSPRSTVVELSEFQEKKTNQKLHFMPRITLMKDWDKLIEIKSKAYSRQISEWEMTKLTTLKNSTVQVANDDHMHGILGYQAYTVCDSFLSVEDIAVHPKFQKKGVARSLLRQFEYSIPQEQWCKNPLYTSARLHIGDDASIRLFKRAGFFAYKSEEGERGNEYIHFGLIRSR